MHQDEMFKQPSAPRRDISYTFHTNMQELYDGEINGYFIFAVTPEQIKSVMNLNRNDMRMLYGTMRQAHLETPGCRVTLVDTMKWLGLWSSYCTMIMIIYAMGIVSGVGFILALQLLAG